MHPEPPQHSPTDCGRTFFEQRRRGLAGGSLVEVLKPYGGRSRSFTLQYPLGRYLPHRVCAFVDFLLQGPTSAGSG